jgi:hypothetical protein
MPVVLRHNCCQLMANILLAFALLMLRSGCSMSTVLFPLDQCESASLVSLLIIPDARIEKRIEDIHRQV